MFREVRKRVPHTKHQGAAEAGRGVGPSEEKGGKTPHFCVSQLLIDLLPVPGWRRHILGGLTVSYPLDPFPWLQGPSAGVIWEEAQAGVSGNRRSKLLCRCS